MGVSAPFFGLEVVVPAEPGVKLRGWKQVSPDDWEDWERRLSEGEEPRAAARARNLSTTAFRKADWRRHELALHAGRLARGEVVDEMMEERVVEQGPDGRPRYREDVSDALVTFHARRWQPAYRQGDRVEVAVGLAAADPFGIGEMSLEQKLALRARLVAEDPGLVEMIEGGRGQLEAGTPGEEA